MMRHVIHAVMKTENYITNSNICTACMSRFANLGLVPTSRVPVDYLYLRQLLF